jgi:hypothetical protein
MAVGADAEEDELERVGQLHVDRPKRMHLLLRDRNAGEERLARHPLVRVFVIRWDDAVVAPPDVPGRPVEVTLGQPPVDRLGRAAARERDPERARPLGAPGDPVGAELR